MNACILPDMRPTSQKDALFEKPNHKSCGLLVVRSGRVCESHDSAQELTLLKLLNGMLGPLQFASSPLC